MRAQFLLCRRVLDDPRKLREPDRKWLHERKDCEKKTNVPGCKWNGSDIF